MHINVSALAQLAPTSLQERRNTAFSMSKPARAKAAPQKADSTRNASGDRMELLETFIRSAETGGIGAAARAMGATQPTVTRRLQQLEGALSAKLVERGPQGLSLTPLGARLLPEARQMAARWTGLEEMARLEQGEDPNASLVGRVRLSASRGLGAAFLPPIIAEFMVDHPDVRVDLRFEDDADDAEGAIAAEGLDFALRVGRNPAAAGEVSREIARTRRMLCATPETAERVAVRRGVEIARCEPLALEDEGLIVTAGVQPEALRFVGRQDECLDVRFEPIATFDDDEAALDLALAGVGLALLPTWRIAPLLSERRLTVVAQHWSEGDSPVSIAWAPNRFRSAAAMALLELVASDVSALLAEV